VSRPASPLLFAMLLTMASSSPARCQQPIETGDASPAYENRNQIDYGPLRIGRASGVVTDSANVAIPTALILLFTEKDHTLITHSKSKEDGTFDLGQVRGGRYRLVVKFDGFCPANVPVDLKPRGHRSAGVRVHMRPAAIDTCSYGDVQ